MSLTSTGNFNSFGFCYIPLGWPIRPDVVRYDAIEKISGLCCLQMFGLKMHVCVRTMMCTNFRSNETLTMCSQLGMKV